MHKTILFKFFILLFLISSCGGREDRAGNPSPPPKPIPKSPIKSEAPQDATVKIYFENTLSMDGYINGNTNFKDVFRELLVAVDNENNIDLETEFYLLNNELTPTNFGVDNTKISEKLTPKSTAGKGNKGSSNFEEILNTVLQNQEGDVISVVMADFIYSPDGQQNTPSALNKLRTYTQDAFLKALNQNPNLATRVYRFTSDFDGTYFDIDNKHIQGVKSRPYYYFVIAPGKLMSVFDDKIATQLKNAPGYQNEALFDSANFSEIPIEILAATANNGRIRAKGNNIEVRDYPRSGNLEFTVLVDLSELPVNNQYLIKKNNYELPNSEFSIKEIGLKKGKNLEFEDLGKVKINPAGLVKILDKNFTHAIIFQAEGMVSEDLKFSLKKSIPNWIKTAHSSDDQKIHSDSLEQTKTFGFGHLVQGVSRAYELQNGNDEYFKLTIPVK